MTKKILALALAGTTAFSVFGGLNVFAAGSEHGDSEAYKAYKPVGEITTTEKGWARFDGKVFDDVTLVTVMDFDDVMETTVENGAVYFYDFLDLLNDTNHTRYDQDDVEEAIENGLNAEPVSSEELSKILGGGSIKADQTITMETGYGDRGTIRDKVVYAFEDFVEGISLDLKDYEYLYDYDGEGEDDDVYNFKAYIDTLKEWVGTDLKPTKDDDYLKQTTSGLVYMMQEYERLVTESEYVSVKEIDTEALAELLIAALEARTEDDYDSAREYRAWTADLEKLVEKYEEAETRGEYKKAYDALEAAVIAKDSKAAKADLTDLAAAKTVTMTVAGEEYELYPEEDYKVTSTTTTEEYDWYKAVLGLAEAMYKNGKNYNFQGSVDVVTEALLEAIDALVPTTEPRASRLLSLEEYVDKYQGLVEGDYKAAAWKDYSKAMEYATTLLEGEPGKQQVANAVAMLIPAAEAMDKCANHTKVKASSVTALRNAIKDAKAWLKDYDADTASAGQVLAVTKALDNAEDVLDSHTDGYKVNENCALVSEVEGAIADIDDALNFAGVALGWSKNADGKWIYGTAEGYLNNGWNKINNCWYYFNADGTAKQNEWFKDGNDWFWLTNSCNAAHGWYKINGDWYFFRDGGYMVTGWRMINGLWYYMDASGKMQTGWVNVGGKSYYLSKEAATYGAMLTNTTTPDGYKVGADGAWIK